MSDFKKRENIEIELKKLLVTGITYKYVTTNIKPALSVNGEDGNDLTNQEPNTYTYDIFHKGKSLRRTFNDHREIKDTIEECIINNYFR